MAVKTEATMARAGAHGCKSIMVVIFIPLLMPFMNIKGGFVGVEGEILNGFERILERSVTS